MQEPNYLSTTSACLTYMPAAQCMVSYTAWGSLLWIEETPCCQDIVTYYVCVYVSAAPPPHFYSIIHCRAWRFPGTPSEVYIQSVHAPLPHCDVTADSFLWVCLCASLFQLVRLN